MATTEKPECASCGDPVDDSAPITRIGDGRRVCDPSCVFDVLASEAVTTEEGKCPVCGEEYQGGRTPTARGYDMEMCSRCAKEVERRAPRPGEAA